MWLNVDVLPSPLNQGKEEENRKGAQALEKEEIIIGGWVDRESEDRGENEEWQGKKNNSTKTRTHGLFLQELTGFVVNAL